MAPTSKIKPTAEYDAAAALIQLKDWETAATVLVEFRNNFPGHPLQPEVTKKIAYVYKENNQLSLAANEYERIEKESDDDEVRREALLIAAELHEKDGNSVRALEVYCRYVDYFPQPVETNLEMRNKIAEILKSQNDRQSYLNELEQIVAIDASAGSARTSRTRYLAARSALVLAEQSFNAFVAVKLEKPFEVNLSRKRELMKTATEKFSQLLDYEIGEFTAAATFYMAEIYADFSKALTASERPEGLNPQEREKYELAIEEQAYPFEEKAIAVHEDNLKLISRGVYNEWIEKSLHKLAEFVPARYDKPEEPSCIVGSLETYIFEISRPAPPQSAQSQQVEPTQIEEPEVVTEPERVQPVQEEEYDPATESEPAKPVQVEERASVNEPESIETAPLEKRASVTESEVAGPTQLGEPKAVTESEPAGQVKIKEGESVDEPESTEPARLEESGSVAAETVAPLGHDEGTAPEPRVMRKDVEH
jgi:tetratricopeptide (TPR) repeat protein